MYGHFGGTCRTCVYPAFRIVTQLSPKDSIISRFPTLADIDRHHVPIKSTVKCVLLRCNVQTIWGGSDLRVRLVITLWVIRYHLLSAKSVWSLLMIKRCVSGSVTTGCYLNNGVEILLCACNQWIGWSVWQAVINISWLYDEVAQLLGYLTACFVRLASSWLAHWSGEIDYLLVMLALSLLFDRVGDIFVSLLVR